MPRFAPTALACLVQLTALSIMLGVSGKAQTTPDAVTETGRGPRSVMLAL